MPSALALGLEVIKNTDVSIFAVFGSMALLLLVDFRGTMADRVRAQGLLALVGVVFVCLGTLASRSDVVAAIAMALVGGAVIFAGVISSVLASATTPLLLAFIVPVALSGPASTIPDRLAGWGIASGFSLIAITLAWPFPVQNPLREATIAACRALAARLRIDGDGEPPSPSEREALDREASAMVAAVARLFTATPYRPTALSTGSRILVRLVDELRWLAEIVALSEPASAAGLAQAQLRALHASAATVLTRGADLLAETSAGPAALGSAVAELHAAVDELKREVTRHVPTGAGGGERRLGKNNLEAFQAALKPGFRGQELSFIVAQIAANIELAAAAEGRGWLARMAGRQPHGIDGPLASARARASAHLDRHSVWLHNSLRGGVALGLAVLLADVLEVQHAFWVVLGTLTVLRSTALSTGQTVAQAMLGAVAGFVVGSALVLLFGTNDTVLWLLLPVAVLLAGFTPTAVSFAAGQASFTVALLILFNLFAPAGWKIGLVRVEDVAIGGATSLVVGLLLWPRGAAAALADALSDAYAQTARYLTAAVAFATSCCDSGIAPRQFPAEQAVQASAAARRLDDAFRGFVAEHGTKRLPLAQATTLVNGPSALRLTGDAILDLWRNIPPADESRAGASRELVARSEALDGWYHDLAAALERKRAVPEPAQAPDSDDDRLLQTIEGDLRGGKPSATAAAVRIIWTGDHLDAARRLEGIVAAPASAVLEPSAAAVALDG